jgi:hypothetical protein
MIIITHIRGSKLLRVLDMSGLKPQQLLGNLYGRSGRVLRVYIGGPKPLQLVAGFETVKF